MSPVPAEEREREISRRELQQREQRMQQEQQELQQPSDVEIIEYATGVLGIDPIADAELLHLSREGLTAPLPPAWRAVQDSESGDIYFYHERTERVTWEHPADKHYKKLAKAALVEKYGSSSGGAEAAHTGSSSECTDSDSEVEQIEAASVNADGRQRRPSLPRGQVPAPPPRPRGAKRPSPFRAVTMGGNGAVARVGAAPPVPFRRPGMVHVIGATGGAARTGGMALSPRDRRYSGGDQDEERRRANTPLAPGQGLVAHLSEQRQHSPSAPTAARDVDDDEALLLPASDGAADRNNRLEEV